MVKKTINFHDEKVLEKFDKQITKKYGSIRGNRTNVLEMLMNEYSSGTYEENNEKLEQLNQKVSKLTTEYETLLAENTKLQEDNEKYHDVIDELSVKLETLEKEVQTLRTENTHMKELMSEKNNRIIEYQTNITSLNKKVTSKENEYKHLEEVRNKDLEEKNNLTKKISKYSYVIGYIENMSLLDRILKKYPDEMKALPENTEN